MEPPPNWLGVIDNIRAVRKRFPAPVDSMGCDQAHTKTDKTTDQRFQILVSLMLSSQTKDPITWAAVQKLKQAGLGNVNGIIGASEKDIEDLIFPVGFYRRKAIYLKKTAEILKETFAGDIPDNLKDLCSLPGVGPKMAHLCMNEAWKVVTGIGVDTHVHRISARLGWVSSKGIKAPEDTRKALESWLPREYWSEINHLLVGFGQTICAPVRPKCDQCYNQALCPYYASDSAVKRGSTKQRKQAKIKVEANPSTHYSLAKGESLQSSQRKEKLKIELEPSIDDFRRVRESETPPKGTQWKADPTKSGESSQSVEQTRIKVEPVDDFSRVEPIEPKFEFETPDIAPLKEVEIEAGTPLIYTPAMSECPPGSQSERIKVEPNSCRVELVEGPKIAITRRVKLPRKAKSDRLRTVAFAS